MNKNKLLEMEIKYKAPKGLSVKIVTSIVLILYVSIIFKIIHEILNSNRRPVGIIIGFGIFTIIIVISYVLSLKSYIISDSELIIKQLIKSKRINIKAIKDIKLIQNKDLKGLIRIFGIGGLFGDVGKFYHKKLGRLNLFASQHKNIVLIETTDKKYIITPNDIDIIDKIKERMPASL